MAWGEQMLNSFPAYCYSVPNSSPLVTTPTFNWVPYVLVRANQGNIDLCLLDLTATWHKPIRHSIALSSAVMTTIMGNLPLQEPYSWLSGI